MANAFEPFATFIVRLSHDPAGRVRAVIERASSGAKHQVDNCEAIGSAIAGMLKAETDVFPSSALSDRPGSGIPRQEPRS